MIYNLVKKNFKWPDVIKSIGIARTIQDLFLLKGIMSDMDMNFESIVLWTFVEDAVEESQINELMPHLQKILRNHEIEYENGTLCITIYFKPDESN